MAATINELAQQLNLSKGTISRILNGKGEAFSADTRERVLAAAQAAGYRPNPIARALATGHTGIIALWLWSDGLQDSYHAQVSHAWHAELMRHPYQLMVSPVGRRTLEFAREKSLSPWQVDGVVAHEASPAVEALLGEGALRRVPIVSTGAYNLFPGADHVGIDLSAGAVEAMHHLVVPGRRRIAYIAERFARDTQDPRPLAYLDVMREAGLQSEVLSTPDVSRGAARRAVREYVEAKGCPEAIFCHTDTLAIGAYRGLRDLGVRIPDDVALVGCDGLEDTEYLDVPISTIVQPLKEMCRLAWKFLERRMADPDRPVQETWLQPRLAIRASSQVSAEVCSEPAARA